MSVLLPEKMPIRHHERKKFTAEEKDCLMQLIAERITIVGCKETDSFNCVRKREAWEEIRNEFNSNPNHEKRTITQLQKCWDNEKTRRKRSEEKLIRLSGSSDMCSDISDGDETTEEDLQKTCSNSNTTDQSDFHVLPSGEVIFGKYSESDGTQKPAVKRLKTAQLPQNTLDGMEHQRQRESLEIELLEIQIQEAKVRRDIALIDKERAIFERDLARDKANSITSHFKLDNGRLDSKASG